MPTTNYSIRMVESAGGIGTFISRNSTTAIVDATSGAPNRLSFLPYNNFSAGVAQITISGATQATPIVLTVPSATGFATGDFVLVRDVLGNTNANGVFAITVSGTSITLVGSAGAAAYTSGGTMTLMPLTPSYNLALPRVCAAILNDKSLGN